MTKITIKEGKIRRIARAVLVREGLGNNDAHFDVMDICLVNLGVATRKGRPAIVLLDGGMNKKNQNEILCEVII